MSSFTSPLDLRDLGDRTFQLLSPFAYNGITVPAGEVTDFASVPRMLWSVLPPYGKYGKAAVIHDYLYKHRGLGRYTRKQCDQIFLEAMKSIGVNIFTRRIMYVGVRLGGRSSW